MKSLEDKRKTYLQKIKKVQDKYGFIEHDKCDSLGLTALASIDPEVKVDIESAYDKEAGMWHRRPLSKPCYSCGESKSTISRDHLLMLAYHIYYKSKLELSESVTKYALSHYLVMGEGFLSRTIMSPGLLATYCELEYQLGGKNRWYLRWIPANFTTKALKGYKAHLQVLHILLRFKLTGKLNYFDRKVLEKQAKRQPNNALFQYAAGYNKKAREILKRTDLFPENRLPINSDRKTEWLWMRDETNKDWGSAPQTDKWKRHSGGDFLFVYRLLTDD